MDVDKVFRLIKAMNDEGVDYITFGAVALNLHGVLRATTDADRRPRPPVSPDRPTNRRRP